MEQFIVILTMLAIMGYVVLLVISSVRESKHKQRVPDSVRTKLVCAFCGYDLETSKDRCPECGRPILVHPDAELNLEVMRKNVPIDALDPRRPAGDEELMTIHVARSHVEAYLLHQLMEFRGIRCTCEQPEFRRDLYCVRVYSGDRDDALTLLQRIREGKEVSDPKDVSEVASKIIPL